MNSRPSRGTLPWTTAAVTTGSLPDPLPEWRTCGQMAAVAKNARQMQVAGSTTAGGVSAASTVCGRRDAGNHVTISSVIAVALQPTNTIASESSGTPPSRANGRNGPSVWPAATTPQGNPPNGTVDFSHSCAAHNTANQIGHPGSCRTTTADRPKIAGKNAHTSTSASNGMTPSERMLTQWINGR